MPLFVFILWIILNGRITWELVLFGIVISAAVSYFGYIVTRYVPEHDIRLVKNLPLLLLYLFNLIWEIIKAALSVILLILHAEDPDPVIIEFHSGLKTNLQNVLLANSITLTPGTITVFQDKDYFVVHCLRREYARGMEESSFVKLLRRLK